MYLRPLSSAIRRTGFISTLPKEQCPADMTPMEILRRLHRHPRRRRSRVSPSGTGSIDRASRLFAAGYRVCLLIDAQFARRVGSGDVGLDEAQARHRIVLRSKIERSGGNLKMTVITWGDYEYKGHKNVLSHGGSAPGELLRLRGRQAMARWTRILRKVHHCPKPN